MERRSIVKAVIFSFITCGIYGIYWFYKMTDECHYAAGRQTTASGGMAIVYSLVTCGIYMFYWMYKMGERVDRINGVNGNSNILYMLVSLFGFSIVSYCLMQDTVNRHCGSGMM